MIYFSKIERYISAQKRVLTGFQIIILLILFTGVWSKTLYNNCPPINSTKEQYHTRHQRFVLAFSNAELVITPKIEIPIELSASVSTGFTVSLPITIIFQSKFDLITNWLKQISSTTSSVTNSFTSLTAALTQLLANIPPKTNVSTANPATVSGVNAATSSSGAASDVINRITANTYSTSTNNSNINLNGRSFGAQHFDKNILLTKFANQTRADSRAKFYQSIEMSHSKFGKSCLLRAICEAAQTPLMDPNSGILGEIIDMFLTISPIHYDLTNFEDYINAQKVGQNSFTKHSNLFRNYTFNDECIAKYGTECPFSLFKINHIISIL